LHNQRFVLLAFTAGALLLGLVVQAACVSGFAQFAVPDNRVAGLLNTTTVIAMASGVVFFVWMIRNKGIIQYTDECIGELRQVIWPTRDEAVRASTTVVLTTLFTAAVLAIYDVIWKTLADMILYTS